MTTSRSSSSSTTEPIAYLLPEPTGEPVPVGRSPVTIGRSPENTIANPDDRLLSRRHAYVVREEARVLFCDHASTNGSYLNGVRVRGCVPLAAGDRLTCGLTSLRVEIS